MDAKDKKDLADVIQRERHLGEAEQGAVVLAMILSGVLIWLFPIKGWFWSQLLGQTFALTFLLWWLLRRVREKEAAK